MKSKRRHELKENVLAHELVEVKEFFGRYGSWIMGGLVVVLVVALVIWQVRTRSASRLAEEKSRYQALTREVSVAANADSTLAGLIDLAENAADPVVSGMAALDAADFCDRLYVDSLRLAENGKAQGYLEKARKYYRLAIDRYADRQAFAARAHLGLGVLAENGDDWAAARSRYERIGRLVNESFPAAVEAKRRLGQLDTWSQPVRFVPAGPESQPVIEASATRPALDKSSFAPETRPESSSRPSVPDTAE